MFIGLDDDGDGDDDTDDYFSFDLITFSRNANNCKYDCC